MSSKQSLGQQVAEALDDCIRQDGSVDGAGLHESLHRLLDAYVAWDYCDDHGYFSASRDECPYCARGWDTFPGYQTWEVEA